MAIQASVETDAGEARSLYIRLNNMEASNHGKPAVALFRGFVSQEAFEGGGHYLWEREVAFDADVSAPLWPQAYAALKAATALVEGETVEIAGGGEDEPEPSSYAQMVEAPMLADAVDL